MSDICPKHGPYSTPHCRECDLDIIANVESEEPTMPSEMVERCARAACLEDVENDGFFEWDNCGDKDRWRQLARAVLEALREPTEEMVEAGTAAIQAECLADVATVDGWRAMISTALKDSE